MLAAGWRSAGQRRQGHLEVSVLVKEALGMRACLGGHFLKGLGWLLHRWSLWLPSVQHTLGSMRRKINFTVSILSNINF